ncbi:succinate dehydrogenase [Mangrovactinospora gilvigrisea]|uniref:Succinate dehydrogenase n=1 Tax=Mangrovactinospora gilvigrisea TaxID=1428644 RepID=A0A1J7BYR4_9ACTN|nr:succinate dehydrogenase cytochrome b subunit [Mangrovactinospora gilvigrisea]OIV38617.1 succinate dehydrogenase [Mangrovactinospora gilvigrisea]
MRTTIALKALMAVTGIVMLAFLVLHMLGNLKIFFGPEDFNAYSHWLRTLLIPFLHYGWFLWILRVVLVVSVVGHIGSAIVLTKRDRAARPVRYRHAPPASSTYATRTLRYGGAILALFVVFHILDLTTGDANPHFTEGHPYQNLTASFDRWYVAVFYMLAVVLLGLHVQHGLRSAARTLGVAAGRQRAFAALGTALAAVLTAGFLSVPVAVLAGAVS